MTNTSSGNCHRLLLILWFVIAPLGLGGSLVTSVWNPLPHHHQIQKEKRMQMLAGVYQCQVTAVWFENAMPTMGCLVDDLVLR